MTVMWGSPDLTKLDRLTQVSRAYQIDIEKTRREGSHLTAGFFYCAQDTVFLAAEFEAHHK